MRFWILLLWVVLAVPGATAQEKSSSAEEASESGRRGNALYDRGAYAEAEAAYRAGLRGVADTTDAVYARLQNNLGAALYRQEKFEAARQAFQQAARTAPAPSDRIRALYNAGNAAASGGQLGTALDRYRTVLVADPTHEAARHNYEVLKRQMARRHEPQRTQEPPNVDPSPYAQRLKRRAEALVAERRYGAALQVLQDGLIRDSTIAAYQKLITRLEDVTAIQQVGTPSGRPSGGPGQSLRSGPSSESNSSSNVPSDTP